jgi:two-component system copper resistance phosphate regulon response regulator CusR
MQTMKHFDSSLLQDEFAATASCRNIPKRVLIVEDDEPLARFLQREFSVRYAATVVHDGEQALAEIELASCDLLITDLNLPKMDGLELLRKVRRLHPSLPVMVLTARAGTEDRVRAIEEGADDCLAKPFSFKELLVRAGRLLQREPSSAAVDGRVGDLTVNKEEHRVMRGSRRIDLTPREFSILEYMMENIGKPISRVALMRDVWNTPGETTTNVVDVYMKYLRDKVDQGNAPKLIRTVRGIGYVLSSN